jgi:hypothetical protein
MTQKTPGKVHMDHPNPGHSPEELQAAYQIHTLAQYLYGQMLPQQPWTAGAPPMGGFQTMAGFQPMPWQHGWPAAGYAQSWTMQPWQAHCAMAACPFGVCGFPR